MQNNSYYKIGQNDFLFAKAGFETCKEMDNFNNVTSLCAQASEKFLKALIEKNFVDDDRVVKVLQSHNLRSLVNKVKEKFPESNFNTRDCKWLGDFYFDARYPGDNFIESTEQDAIEAVAIAEAIKAEVDRLLAEEVHAKKNDKLPKSLDEMKEF